MRNIHLEASSLGDGFDGVDHHALDTVAFHIQEGEGCSGSGGADLERLGLSNERSGTASDQSNGTGEHTKARIHVEHSNLTRFL
ncbi:hypothetical protein D9M71_646670 [compost metagenome]